MSKEGVCRIFRGNFIFDSFEDVETEWMAGDFNGCRGKWEQFLGNKNFRSQNITTENLDTHTFK